MSDYFDYTTGRLTNYVTARSKLWNDIIDNISAGFAMLPTPAQVKLGTQNYGTDSGAADAYVVTLPYTPTALTDGMRVLFKAANTNTGASTINVSGKGAKSLTRNSGDALSPGDVLAGKLTECVYNATTDTFEIISVFSDALLSAVSALVAASGFKISANDLTVGYANGKLTASGGITLTEGNNGGDETLDINCVDWTNTITKIQTDIAINAFRVLVNGSLTIQDMADGFVDEFTDMSGVVSTDLLYDAVTNRYSSASAFNIGAASALVNTLTPVPYSTDGRGIAVRNSGANIYITCNDTSKVYGGELSTPYDLSTATNFVSGGCVFSGQGTTGVGVELNPTGTAMYVMCQSNRIIFQYTLSTAWDETDEAYASKSLDCSSQVAAASSFCFGNSGAIILAACPSNDAIYQYVLTTPYDLSTGSYDSKTLDVSAQVEGASGVCISLDGKTLIVGDQVTDHLYEYALATAFDISTGVYTGRSFDLTALADFFNFGLDPTGRYLYVVTGAEDSAHQYNLTLTAGDHISAAVTADSAPTEAMIVIRQQDVDSVTLNTDLLAYVSRDNGTTWTQGTLTSEVTLGSDRILVASGIDISGQPSGTSMKYKISTANSKEMYIYGVALMWS